MPNIIVTDCKRSPTSEPENIMIFTRKANVENVKKFCDTGGFTYTEIHEVPNEDVKFYVYDPLFLSPKDEQAMLKHSAA